MSAWAPGKSFADVLKAKIAAEKAAQEAAGKASGAAGGKSDGTASGGAPDRRDDEAASAGSSGVASGGAGSSAAAGGKSDGAASDQGDRRGDEAASADVPAPAVLPKPLPRPAAVAVERGVARCPDPTPKELGYPLGFKDKAQFDECMAELEAALKSSAIKVKAVGVRGSSVTVHSLNPKKMGRRFDSAGEGNSDIDVFFVTEGNLPLRPNPNGMYADRKVAARYPAIDAWSKKWSAKLDPKRKVAAAGFKPAAKKSIKPTSADSIVHRGAL